MVASLAITPDGYLWVGTSDGLSRFDGLMFETFSPGDAAFPVLHADRQGNLWIGKLWDGPFIRAIGAYV